MEQHRCHDGQDAEVEGEYKMNLIDTYVSEVGRQLPSKNRADIEAEIRSALQDMLDERSRKEGRPVDDEMVLAVLKEYGDPDLVAASYLPERYLIGPAMFPVFWTVAKIILTITLIVTLVGLGVNLGQSARDLQTGLSIVGHSVTDLYTSVLTSMAALVFIFAIIEWAINRSGRKMDVQGSLAEKDWDPRSLLNISAPNRIKLGEIIAEIVFTFIAILLFNFYPQMFNLRNLTSGNWFANPANGISVPIFSETFFHYIPYLTIVWVLTIVLDILLLRKGYWNLTTRVLSIGLKVIDIVIAAAMLAGPSLIALTVNDLPATLASISAIRTVINLLPVLVKVALWLGIFGNVVEIIKAFAGMISMKRLAFNLPEKS
jgi:hypothetical protein